MLTDRDAVDYSLTFSFPLRRDKNQKVFKIITHQMNSNPVLQKQLESHFNVKAEISEVPLYHWLLSTVSQHSYVSWHIIYNKEKTHCTGQDELIEPVLLYCQKSQRERGNSFKPEEMILNQIFILTYT